MTSIRSLSKLSTSSLTVGYRTGNKPLALFENLNLHLQPGTLVCFMGPNGAGKSTLIRTMAGLQKPLSGTINIETDDRPMSTLVSVVLTDRIAGTNMTAYDVIAVGRYPYLDWRIRLTDLDLKAIDRAIGLVNVRQIVERKLNELSDGQLQMVMIARALAQDTPIVLLDEPTAHLDLNNRVEIMKLLRSLTRTTGKSILVSTHELDLALQMADWIWLTGKNKDILTGIPEDLVLSGAFDDIFQFKGFDLKTGRVQHAPYREVVVALEGSGPAFLWTRNALERHGFQVTDGNSDIRVFLSGSADTPQWTLQRPHETHVFKTLEDLLGSM